MVGIRFPGLNLDSDFLFANFDFAMPLESDLLSGVKVECIQDAPFDGPGNGPPEVVGVPSGSSLLKLIKVAADVFVHVVMDGGVNIVLGIFVSNGRVVVLVVCGSVGDMFVDLFGKVAGLAVSVDNYRVVGFV